MFFGQRPRGGGDLWRCKPERSKQRTQSNGACMFKSDDDLQQQYCDTMNAGTMTSLSVLQAPLCRTCFASCSLTKRQAEVVHTMLLQCFLLPELVLTHDQLLAHAVAGNSSIISLHAI